jgi:hypothetical protein
LISSSPSLSNISITYNFIPPPILKGVLIYTISNLLKKMIILRDFKKHTEYNPINLLYSHSPL